MHHISPRATPSPSRLRVAANRQPDSLTEGPADDASATIQLLCRQIASSQTLIAALQAVMADGMADPSQHGMLDDGYRSQAVKLQHMIDTCRADIREQKLINSSLASIYRHDDDPATMHGYLRSRVCVYDIR